MQAQDCRWVCCSIWLVFWLLDIYCILLRFVTLSFPFAFNLVNAIGCQELPVEWRNNPYTNHLLPSYTFRREIPSFYYMALMASEAIPFILYLPASLRGMGQGAYLKDICGKHFIKALYIWAGLLRQLHYTHKNYHLVIKASCPKAFFCHSLPQEVRKIPLEGEEKGRSQALLISKDTACLWGLHYPGSFQLLLRLSGFSQN